VHRCYGAGLKRQPGLARRVSVRFVMRKDGAVANVLSGGATLSDAATVDCIVRAMVYLSFRRPEAGIVTVVAPLRLSPPGAAAGSSSRVPPNSARRSAILRCEGRSSLAPPRSGV
jgi:hypothetical protein